MKNKQLLVLFLAVLLYSPSVKASTQTFEEGAAITSPPASNAMFDVNTSAAQVGAEIQITSDEIDSLLDNNANQAAAPEETAAPTQMTEHTVQQGESLWRIAQRLLGDGNRYREIVEANKDKYPSLLKNPDLIHSGWVLKVPITTGGNSEAVAGAPATTTEPAQQGTTPAIDNSQGTPASAATVAQIPQWSVQERIKRLQKALDSANLKLLAQSNRIADLNPATIRYLIDNKYMTEEEWMGMNPPDGYTYRLDRLGKVELVGADNKPLTNEQIAALGNASSAAQSGTTAAAPANNNRQPTDAELAAADAKAKQEAADKLKKEAAEKAAREKADKDKSAKEKAEAEKIAAEKAAKEKAEAEKIAAEKAAKEKAEADKAAKEAEEKAKTKYQQIIKGLGMPDLADNRRGYYDAMNKGYKVVAKGVFSSNSFAKFCDPINFPMYDIYMLQRDLRSSQEHYEKMVDQNRTGRFLGIFGDTIESAGKKVEASKARLEKAWTELKKSLDEAKTKATELENKIKTDKARVEAINKELNGLDKYDSANAAQVQRLNKEAKKINDDISDAQKKVNDYGVLKSMFKL